MKWLRVLAWCCGSFLALIGLLTLLDSLSMGLLALEALGDNYAEHFIATSFGTFEPWAAFLIFGTIGLIPLLGGLAMLNWAWNKSQRET